MTTDGAAEVTGRRDVLRFGAVWTTSVISGMGSALTTFAFGVWIYLETGSAVAFAIGMICGAVPMIVFGPFSGVVVDRFNRRWVLVVTDACSAAAVATVAYLIWAGQAQIWHFYVATVISAAGGTFHLTAYLAMTPMLIPKRHLSRANGLMQVPLAAQIAAPLAAAALLPVAGFAGVLAVDLATFALAMTTLLAVRLPRRVLWAEQPAQPPPFLRDLVSGWRHLGERVGLRSLVVVMIAFNLFFASAAVLVQPLILSFASASTLGVLMFAGGSGMFAGSVAMGLWGGPRRRVRGLVLFFAIGGVALAGHALRPSAVLVGVVAFAFLFTLPVVNGLANTVLQLKVDSSVLGRVMGTAQTCFRLPAPAAYLLAAPLAEYVLGPMMQPGGALAGSLGRVIGTGPGRGIAAVMLCCGLLLVALGAVAWTLPALRRVETALPDADAGRPGGSAPSGGSAPEPAAESDPEVAEPDRPGAPVEAVGRSTHAAGPD